MREAGRGSPDDVGLDPGGESPRARSPRRAPLGRRGGLTRGRGRGRRPYGKMSACHHGVADTGALGGVVDRLEALHSVDRRESDEAVERLETPVSNRDELLELPVDDRDPAACLSDMAAWHAEAAAEGTADEPGLLLLLLDPFLPRGHRAPGRRWGGDPRGQPRIATRVGEGRREAGRGGEVSPSLP